MKKIISVILIIVLVSTIIIFSERKVEAFYLEDKYYNSTKLEEIKIKELEELMDKGESIGVLVYQPKCVTSNKFLSVVKEFQEKYNISFYKIAFSELRNSKEFKKIKYYPSFIVMDKGKLVDYLKANKDEDTKYFKSVDGFYEWFSKYVKLKG